VAQGRSFKELQMLKRRMSVVSPERMVVGGGGDFYYKHPQGSISIGGEKVKDSIPRIERKESPTGYKNLVGKV